MADISHLHTYYRSTERMGFPMVIVYTYSKVLGVYLKGEVEFVFLKKAAIADITTQNGFIGRPEAINGVAAATVAMNDRTDTPQAIDVWNKLHPIERARGFMMTSDKAIGLKAAGIRIPDPDGDYFETLAEARAHRASITPSANHGDV
jgi:hypothetical protein